MLKVGFYCPLFLLCSAGPYVFVMVRERVKAIALPLLKEQGLELLEVQYRREQTGWVLRLIIDR